MKNLQKGCKYKLTLGAILILAGIFLTVFFKDNSSVPVILIVMGMVVFVISALRLFRQEDLPDRDERTKKLAAYGITYSWIFTLVLVTILYWVEFLDMAEFTSEAILGILLFFMLISANVFRWFFMQKGDVE